MKNLILSILLLNLGICSASTTPQLLTAAQAYSKSDLTALSYLSQNNPKSNFFSYLNAGANLTKSNPKEANSFVLSNPSGYFHNDISHRLLDYYFNNQDWNNYLHIYNQLDSSQATINETCGFDLANLAKNSSQSQKININNLISNKMPLWCISLVASSINSEKLSPKVKTQFLNNLIANNQLSQFNQVASALGTDTPIFNANTPSSQLNNSYQIVYRIKSLSQKSPNIAFDELSSANLPSDTKQFLFNQIAADLATRQMFDLAKKAITQGSNQWLSDDEYEWRVRTYLYFNDWSSVITTIKAMPDNLQNSNTWLYWRAYAEGKLKNKTTAQKLLQKIPANYTYYSLLAQAELNSPLNSKYQVTNNTISAMKYADDAQLSFDMYSSGKQSNNSLLIRLATQNLYYIIGQSSDIDKATISRTAFNLGWNEMGIYAATKLTVPDASLSFPLFFVPQYKQYAQQFGIETSYPMAITRQESRFNPNALAFDGGVGLMQIMPATAKYIAKKVGSDNCYKNYACNIQFGSWFLAHLMTKFGNNIIYASAGYNAGPGRAHRWQQAFRNLDNRIQIELIPFKITRDYVQKVSTNKLVYDNLINSTQINMIDFLNKISNKNTTYIIDDDNTNGDAAGSELPSQ